MKNEITPEAHEVIERLRRAVQTACNDDVSEAGTEKRARHIERVDAMEEAIVMLSACDSGLELALDVAERLSDVVQELSEKLAGFKFEKRRP